MPSTFDTHCTVCGEHAQRVSDIMRRFEGMRGPLVESPAGRLLLLALLSDLGLSNANTGARSAP